MAKREIDFGISTEQVNKGFDNTIEKLRQMKEATSELNNTKTNNAVDGIENIGKAANKVTSDVKTTITELKRLDKLLSGQDINGK